MHYSIQKRLTGCAVRFLLLALLSSVSHPILANDGIAVPPGTGNPIDMLWGIKIPMRDGVRLNATVYKPKDMEAPLPVIFTLTPYVSDTYHERAYYFAQNGYVFVLVDVRGRGNSDGTFDPISQEAKDGHDVVEWLARQPWSDGQVAMWGGSYAGYDQWATLTEFPPHLRTIVPAAAAFPGVDWPYRKIFYPYEIQWLTVTSGVTDNANLFGEKSFWIRKFRERYLSHAPMADLDRIVGNPSTVYQTWRIHTPDDAFWATMAPTDEQFARMNIPILTITGHYDGDQPGAMEYYRRHMRIAPPDAHDRHFLIMGPWDHAGTRKPNKEFGGLKFGDASVIDLNKLHKEWYDWAMKKGSRPEFLKGRIAYYMAGAEEWKYAESLNEIGSNRRRFYLNSDAGRANDVFQSGTLSDAPPDRSTPDNYTYDPLDTRPAELETEEIVNYLTDQRYALNLYGNGLIYHSEPFAEDTEIAGYFEMTAWIAMDVPDTDFRANIYEVMRDGSCIHLTSDTLRARYRETLRAEKLVKPGEVNRYVLDGFTFISRRIAKGSRIRLIFASPNSIYDGKNYNSGGVVSEESGKDARTAHVKLFHDARRQSYLEIPFAR